MKTLLIVTLAVTGALAMGQGNQMPSYSDFDRNGNGEVTQKEFKNAHQMRMTERKESGRMMRNAADAPSFSDIDANNDGNIDKAELKRHQTQKRKGMLGQGQGRGQGKGSGQGKNR